MKRCICRTAEFRRIAALPYRSEYRDYSQLLTLCLKTPEGSMTLRREQAWALHELMTTGGLLGNLEVGSGKTLITLLAPVILEAERPLLLVPASLRDKTLIHDIPALAKHWRLHPNLKILSYEQLSQVKQAEVLNTLAPDLIVCDEAHRAKNRKAALTRRLVRYLETRPTTRFVSLSGTTTRRSLRDYSHLAQFALGEGSPVPSVYSDLEDWADALDEGFVEDQRPDAGALMVFAQAPEDTPRLAYQRRLRETVGVVSTANPAVGASLRVLEYPVEVPALLEKAFERMRVNYATPGGEEVIVSALDMARHCHELILGFYYHWVWPSGVPDYEWLRARRAWRSYVRAVVAGKKEGSRAGGKFYDSELQVARGCAGGVLVTPNDEYGKWVAIRDRVAPLTEPVWVSSYMIDEAERWARGTRNGIVWYGHRAVGEALRSRGLPVFGPGENGITTATQTCAASVHAHGTGKNLQAFNQSLWLTFPSSGGKREQVLGRQHRPGQEADEVVAYLPLPCIEAWESFDQARRDAAYIEQTTGQRQKLCYADVVVTDGEEVGRRVGSVPPDPLWTKRGPPDRDKDED